MEENRNLPTASEEAILPERDYGQEVEALYAARPELKGQELPDSVVRACVAGEDLSQAYAAYENQVRIERQNTEAAAKAPIRGVTMGGGTDQKAEDIFLRGFNSQW